MEKTQIYARPGKIIFEDVFDDNSIAIPPELSAKEVVGWNSLTHIRLILRMPARHPHSDWYI